MLNYLFLDVITTTSHAQLVLGSMLVPAIYACANDVPKQTPDKLPIKPVMISTIQLDKLAKNRDVPKTYSYAFHESCIIILRVIIHLVDKR